jgi:hypothetical protein
MMLNRPRAHSGPGGATRHRLGFHALVITIGFIAGGTFQSIARQFLPPGPAKELLTAGLTPYVPSFRIDLILLEFTLGPVAIDVSILSLLGILIAYLIARTLF